MCGLGPAAHAAHCFADVRMSLLLDPWCLSDAQRGAVGPSCSSTGVPYVRASGHRPNRGSRPSEGHHRGSDRPRAPSAALAEDTSVASVWVTAPNPCTVCFPPHTRARGRLLLPHPALPPTQLRFGAGRAARDCPPFTRHGLGSGCSILQPIHRRGQRRPRRCAPHLHTRRPRPRRGLAAAHARSLGRCPAARQPRQPPEGGGDGGALRPRQGGPVRLRRGWPGCRIRRAFFCGPQGPPSLWRPWLRPAAARRAPHDLQVRSRRRKHWRAAPRQPPTQPPNLCPAYVGLAAAPPSVGRLVVPLAMPCCLAAHPHQPRCCRAPANTRARENPYGHDVSPCWPTDHAPAPAAPRVQQRLPLGGQAAAPATPAGLTGPHDAPAAATPAGEPSWSSMYGSAPLSPGLVRLHPTEPAIPRNPAGVPAYTDGRSASYRQPRGQRLLAQFTLALTLVGRTRCCS